MTVKAALLWLVKACSKIATAPSDRLAAPLGRAVTPASSPAPAALSAG